MTNAETCPNPPPAGPSGHHWGSIWSEGQWRETRVRLDGVLIQRCTRCDASRVTLANGLRDFLEALEMQMGLRDPIPVPESHMRPNQEHAKKLPWHRPRAPEPQDLDYSGWRRGHGEKFTVNYAVRVIADRQRQV